MSASARTTVNGPATASKFSVGAAKDRGFEAALRPGYQYRIRLMGFASLVIMTIFFLVAPFAPADEPGRVWGVLIFGVLALLALGAYLPFSTTVTLQIDEAGIRLSRSDRVRRSLAWEEMKSLQVGNLRLSLARTSPRTDPYIVAFGKSKPVLRVTGGFYTTDPGTLDAAVDSAVAMATAHGVSVVREDERF